MHTQLECHVNLCPVFTYTQSFPLKHLFLLLWLVLPKYCPYFILVLITSLNFQTFLLLKHNIMNHTPILSFLIFALESQSGVNKIFQSGNFQIIECITECFKRQKLLQTRLNNIFIDLFSSLNTDCVGQVHLVEDEDIWISSSEKTKHDYCEISTFELKSIDIATLQSLLVQEHPNFNKFLFFDILLEFQQTIANKREIVKGRFILGAYFFKNKIVKCGNKSWESSSCYHQGKSVPNQLLQSFFHQDLDYQTLLLKDFGKSWTDHFPSCQVYHPLALPLLYLNRTHPILNKGNYAKAINSFQNIQAITHIFFKVQKILQMMKNHYFHNIITRISLLHGLYYFMPLRLDTCLWYFSNFLYSSQLHLYTIINISSVAETQNYNCSFNIFIHNPQQIRLNNHLGRVILLYIYIESNIVIKDMTLTTVLAIKVYKTSQLKMRKRTHIYSRVIEIQRFPMNHTCINNFDLLISAN